MGLLWDLYRRGNMTFNEKLEDENWKCENCKWFKQLYVPNLNIYRNIPKDAYICGFYLRNNEQAMYLGTEKQGAKLGMCEYFCQK